MKLFIEHLLERELVKKEALIEGLLAQTATLPSLAEIVYRENLLDRADILRALILQAKEKLAFKEACTRLGLWSAELESKTDATIRKQSPSLFRWLVEHDVIEAEKLSQSFSEYLNKSASLDWADLFSEGYKNELLRLIEVLRSEQCLRDQSQLRGTLTSAMFLVHQAAGAARFLGRNSTERLLLVSERLIIAALRKKGPFSSSSLGALADAVEKAVMFAIKDVAHAA